MDRSKIFEAQRERKYKEHLDRIQSIAVKKKGFFPSQSLPPKKSHENGYKIKRKREVEEENKRMVQRLNQICKRRNNYISDNEEERFYTLNMKYRQIIRDKQVQQIQIENDNIVDRIVSKLSRHQSIMDVRDHQLDRSRSKKKHSKKYQRNKSVLLPHIEIPSTIDVTTLTTQQ